MKASYLLSSLALALVIPLSATGTTDTSAPAVPSSPQVPLDQLYEVKREHAVSSTIVGGAVIPHKMVKLLTQMPGEVEFIGGKEGDFFKAGEELVKQDIKALLAKREAALAGLNSAEAGLSSAMVQLRQEQLNPNARSNSMLAGMPQMMTMFTDPMRSMSGQGSPGYERYSNLHGQNVQVQTARNQIEQAKAGIRELDENIRNAITVAPFDGTIVTKMVEVGDVVQPGMPLIVFADTSLMQIQVEVPTRLLDSFSEGQDVNVRIDRGDDLVKAKVSRVFPMAAMGGHTTTVKIDLPKGTNAKAGMYAEVLVADPRRQQAAPLTVPTSAITWRGSLPAVFMASEDRTHLKMRSLRIGAQFGDRTVVLSGLSEGDKIVKQPVASMRSGPYRPSAN